MAKIKLKKPQRKDRDLFIDLGAGLINVTDEILDEVGEIAGDGGELIIDVAAGAVKLFDKTADIIDWIAGKTFILAARKVHDGRMKLHDYRRELIKLFMIALIGGTAIIATFALVTDYEYAYNGRTLGLVRDQQDVLEILDLVSEELTQEYGSSITINPETDITFTPVFSYGKEIDDADTVLKRFTYMGDIQAQAYAIYADGELLAVVESEKIAEEVLDKVLDNYLENDDNVEYEYAGFAEEIEIEPYNTSLANVTSKNAAYNKIKSGGQQEVTYEVVAGDT